ncbi:MAG TPA: hypothetical protein VK181_00110 [Rhizobium sp.]|nr:hypothetical protein [Rhizobium sp.]
MKRLVVLFVAVLIAASVAIFVNKGSGSEAGEAVGASVDSRDTGERAARGRVAIDSSLPEAPRRLPGKVIGGRTTLVNLLIDGVDLTDGEIVELSRFIDEFRGRILSVLFSHARITSDETGLVRVAIVIAPETAMELREQCYAGVAEIIGDEKIKQLAEMHRLALLDGEFENYGEFSMTITATAKQVAEIELVHLRTETKRTMGGDPATIWGEGALLPDYLVKRYGPIGAEIHRRLKPP